MITYEIFDLNAVTAKALDCEGDYSWNTEIGYLGCQLQALSFLQIQPEVILTPTRVQVDGMPLSRPKKNIARDFADGGIA